MSSTDLYILNQKSTRHYEEFRNGWLSAPIIWEYLAQTYLGVTGYLNQETYEKIWPLASDDRLTNDERFVLMMTFDKAYVPLDCLKTGAGYCEMFHLKQPQGHWFEIGKTLREISTLKWSRYTRGVCLSCTSVNDVWADPTKFWLEEAWSIADYMKINEAA